MASLTRLQSWSRVGDWRLLAVLWAALAVLGFVRDFWICLTLGAAVTVGSVAWALYRRYPMHDNWMPAWMRLGIVGLVVVTIVRLGTGVPPHREVEPPAQEAPAVVKKPTQPVARVESEADRQTRMNIALYRQALADAKAGNMANLDSSTRKAVDALPREALNPPSQQASAASQPQANENPPSPDLNVVIEKDPKGLAGWLGKLCNGIPAQGVVSPSCAALGMMLASVGISLGPGKEIHQQVEALRKAQNGDFGPLISLLAQRPVGAEGGVALLLNKLSSQVGLNKAALADAVRVMTPDQWCTILAAASPSGRISLQSWAKATGMQQGAPCR